MTLNWLVVTIALALCALKFFSNGGFWSIVFGLITLGIVLFCILGTYYSWRGFHPTEFVFGDEVIDGKSSKSTNNP